MFCGGCLAQFLAGGELYYACPYTVSVAACTIGAEYLKEKDSLKCMAVRGPVRPGEELVSDYLNGCFVWFSDR